MTVEDYRVTTANSTHSGAQLRQIFRYDAETGKLFWRIDKARAHAGDEACTPHNTGYLSVQIDGVQYLVHRVIWCMVHGEFPKSLIDHDDTDKTNNRLDNLRLATGSKNCYNQTMRTDNTSGVKGVCWHKRIGKWQARLQIEGKRTCKYFSDFDEAIAFMEQHRKEGHKEFANNGKGEAK